MEQHEEIRDWHVIAGLPDPDRLVELRRHYDAVVPLMGDNRRARMHALVEAEYALSDEDLLKIASARLRAWLAMDPDSVGGVVDSYEQTMRAMPGSIAMRRVQAVQTIALTMHSDELERLKDLIPSVLKQIPSLAKVRYAASTSSATSAVPVAAGAKPSKASRRAWEFWKRD
ncbi:MAG: hypothetical protein O3B84_06360 [Chloroflexi bacterium]|nr:hypothetical protein [Chloroflexota bacterium]